MRLITVPSRAINDHGSTGVEMILCLRSEAASVHHAVYAPGGRLGRHPATCRQQLTVVSGSGWATGASGKRQELQVGNAVVWEAGEAHESGTVTGMTALIVERHP